MADTVLTRQQILDATEDVLRRYGPAKATVADVARALTVSPGSIYRHFPTKSALREAVAGDWLDRVHGGLKEIAALDTPAPERLRQWLTTLFHSKKTHARDEPELFGIYTLLVTEHSEVGVAHVQDLVAQIRVIISSGIERGEFTGCDAGVAATAVFSATAQFHNPLHAREWSSPDIDRTFEAVTDLLLAGLR
ncbi:DNA-binding transcriptional regulator, AcrR family [Nonomuraea maritima]|uniref:DNA-binding transcriptional regulator, AcrR family n=1 Tax=Nonomuraea maritima TaxID=683260 RepID=A0A1G9IX84_9ACTN|nr:TetR family transcriptional regulator [Nonomuraea maritima]SDL29889.1 DNA-binding transcriptional regulator, AcrR family [Nonomuraea maritima]